MESLLSSNVLTKHRTQAWQVAVSAFVCAYLAVGVATNSVRIYHWFMLLAIPGALLSAERGRRFFLDWAPLFAFWLVYDRLRLFQPLLYSRVAVEGPYSLEQKLFGWMVSGDIPAHEAYAWLSADHGTLAKAIEWAAQLIYFSHLFLVPLAIAALWVLGITRERSRAAFQLHVRAFTLLNFSAIAIYLLIPVAPPWWVTLNGMVKPTTDLVLHADMTVAMHGSLIQAMIRNASQWFAAVPSLHGAYPVLLLLLAWRHTKRATLVVVALYCGAMWASTVILNQHYVIDLVAGAILAIIAYYTELIWSRWKEALSDSHVKGVREELPRVFEF
jgi:inositol phosphorylceramide synthase catalytic subunit